MPENISISFSGITIIKIKDFIVQYRKYIVIKLKDFDLFLVFNRYQYYSIKSAARAARGKSIKKPTMKLSKKEDILNIPDNKKQLIAHICDRNSQKRP